MDDIQITQILLGPMANFTYIIHSETHKQALIVDPGWEAPILIQKLKVLSCTPVGILLTHGHYDHINAIPELLRTYPDLPVYFSKEELPIFQPDCSTIIGIGDQTTLELLGTTIRCIATPGHSPGGICFEFNNNLITGDTLFIEGIGRCDLPGSNLTQMRHSLIHQLMPLNPSLMVYPGHDYGNVPCAQLGQVIQTNSSLRSLRTL